MLIGRGVAFCAQIWYSRAKEKTIMVFHKVTPAQLGREKEFSYFCEQAPCSFSMCVELDVTEFFVRVKEAGVQFFPSFLYCLSAEVNAHREFRMSENENGFGWYDKTNPCYTVFHDEVGRFSNVWTEFDEDFFVFYARYQSDAKEYGGSRARPDKPYAEGNLFNVSCIPWVSFTGFSLNLPKSSRFFSPIFTIGKYFDRGEKRVLPLALQVHHAVCDGWHAAMFVQGLQERVNAFSALRSDRPQKTSPVR